MAGLDSHSHVELIINGHRVTTWASDDPPYIIETDESAEFQVGQDGKLYGLGRADFGGTLRVRLAPHSPSVQWFINRENERKQRIIDQLLAQSFSGTLTNVARNIDYSLKGGAIQMFPPVTIANQTYEAVLRFEQFISNVDGGAFAERFDENGV